VGGDPKAAARRALPPSLRDGAEIEDSDGVSVRVRVPQLLRPLPVVRLGAKTELGPADG
jgi:hypothetical protein